ncbi:MAG: hypothetical protein IPI67_21015 [Myxococcales bacterium]|nr:hypothetical protein [Myxococcales bacterium]
MPSLVGRVATEDDVRDGRAVFYVDGPCEPLTHPHGLPALAVHTDEAGAASLVVVIQLERTEQGDTVGARYLVGGNMVCMLPELRFVDELEARSLL